MRERGTLSLFPLWKINVFIAYYPHPKSCIYKLNSRTEKPHFENERNSAFRVQMRGGSFGYVSPSIRWWQKAGSRTSFSLNGNYMRADGNYPFTLVNGKYVTEEKRNNSAIYTYQIEPTLFHTFKFRYKSRFICQWDMKKSRPPLSLWRGGLSVWASK